MLLASEFLCFVRQVSEITGVDGMVPTRAPIMNFASSTGQLPSHPSLSSDDPYLHYSQWQRHPHRPQLLSHGLSHQPSSSRPPAEAPPQAALQQANSHSQPWLHASAHGEREFR